MSRSALVFGHAVSADTNGRMFVLESTRVSRRDLVFGHAHSAGTNGRMSVLESTRVCRFALLLAGLAACTPAPLVEATSTSTSTSEATTSSSTTAEPTTGGEPDAPLLSRAIAALAVIDLDSDGHLDLVIDGRGSAIEFLRGRGDGSFEPPLALGPPLAELPHQIAGGDLDGEGQRDLVLLMPGAAALLRDGLSVTHEPLPLAPPAYHVVLADTDRDGRDDLIRTGEVEHLACADLDGDARDDLVFTVRADGQDHLHLLLSSRSP